MANALPDYDDPEIKELARLAALQQLDDEFLIEGQNRLPEDLRYGGLYGLLSYLGLTGQQPDPELRDSEAYPDKAVIKPMGMRYPDNPRLGSYAGSLGTYFLPDANPQVLKKLAQVETKTRIDEEYDPDFKGPDYYQRSYPQPDEVRFFQSNIPWVRSKFGQKLIKKGPGGIGGIDDVPKYIVHELGHRGASLPFLKDLLESLDPDSEEYDAIKQLIDDDHYYLKALDEKYGLAPGDKAVQEIYGEYGTHDAQKKLRKLETAQDAIREYLTPERQEELGVRLPIPASKPKGTFERFFDQITDVF